MNTTLYSSPSPQVPLAVQLPQTPPAAQSPQDYVETYKELDHRKETEFDKLHSRSNSFILVEAMLISMFGVVGVNSIIHTDTPIIPPFLSILLLALTIIGWQVSKDAERGITKAIAAIEKFMKKMAVVKAQSNGDLTLRLLDLNRAEATAPTNVPIDENNCHLNDLDHEDSLTFYTNLPKRFRQLWLVLGTIGVLSAFLPQVINLLK
jgi:hypothetical protein